MRGQISEGTKDANDAVNKLVARDSPDVEKAEPFPLDGVYVSSYLDSVKELTRTAGRGASTGFDSIDELFTIAEGQLSIVTGPRQAVKASL